MNIYNEKHIHEGLMTNCLFIILSMKAKQRISFMGEMHLFAITKTSHEY